MQQWVSDVDAGVVVGQLHQMLRVLFGRVARLGPVGRRDTVARLRLGTRALLLTGVRR